MRLSNYKAFITGGSEGLGFAIATKFLAEGAQVVIAAHQETILAAAAKTLDCHGLLMDLRDLNSVESAIAEAAKIMGGLDLIVNNAALTSPSKPVETTSLLELEAMLNTNLRGCFWVMRCAKPHLVSGRGAVLNISSMAGVTGQRDHAAYAMSKGGLNALTLAAASDWGPERIRVNALCPAGVTTPALKRWAAEQPDPDGIEAYLKRIHALGYCANPEEIANAALFLCSPEASFVTGHIMHVSGGSEIGYKT
jgi:meso-butanediol dehydrogenase / (S,S)-butanediol dehydrogenase / diacetyl reductase